MKDPVAPQFSEAQYLAFEEAGSDKYELHHGFLVAFAGGTIEHDAIAYGVRKFSNVCIPRRVERSVPTSSFASRKSFFSTPMPEYDANRLT